MTKQHVAQAMVVAEYQKYAVCTPCSASEVAVIANQHFRPFRPPASAEYVNSDCDRRHQTPASQRCKAGSTIL